MASLNPGIGLKRYTNLLVVIKQTAFEEYSQVSECYSYLECRRRDCGWHDNLFPPRGVPSLCS